MNDTKHAHMNSHWRILAVDLDGTLIGWDHKINERDLDALRRVREAGFHVAICTGRNAMECAGVIAALNFPPPMGLGVFVNGAMICDMATGKAIDSQILAENLVDEAAEFFGARGHAVLILADNPDTRLPSYFMTDHGPPHQATTDWLLVNRVHSERVKELPGNMRHRIVRLGVVINPPESAPLHAELTHHFQNRVTTHSIYSPHYDCQIIEVFPPNVNKWTGLEHLARAIGIHTNQIITIGDDINDLPMLRNAALSFAMASAKPDIQSQAKRLTASQADCGVAKVVSELLAGRLEPT